MNSLRHLDGLAIAGLIVALGVSAACSLIPHGAYRPSGTPDPSHVRAELLAQAGSPEMRADLALLTEPGRTSAGFDVRPDRRRSDGMSEACPDSARIALHKGILLRGRASVDALTRASDIDPSNALPLYLLASEASSHDDWRQSGLYLDTADRRAGMTDYPLPYDRTLVSIDTAGLVLRADLDLRDAVCRGLRDLSRRTIARANREHRSGHTKTALTLLSRMERMGRAVMLIRPHGLVYIAVGSSIERDALQSEREMRGRAGAKARLMGITAELGLLHNARSQMRSVPSALDRTLTRSAMLYGCTCIVIVGTVLVSAWFLLISAALFIVRTRNRAKPRYELHDEVSAEVLSVGRVLRLYALITVPMLALSALCVICGAYGVPSKLLAALPILATTVGTFLLVPRIVAPYRRMFESLMRAGVPDDAAKRMPRADVIEMCRRSLGLVGGSVILVVLFAGCVIGWMRMAHGAYPWQLGNTVFAPLREERRLATKLLAELSEAKLAGGASAAQSGASLSDGVSPRRRSPI